MKKMKYLLSVSILPLLMLFIQNCDDPLTELEKLPKITQSGKDTFGCLVNGKAGVIDISTNAPSYYQTGTFVISAGLSPSLNSLLTFHIYDLNLSEKTYFLTEKLNQADSDFAEYHDFSSSCEYTTTSIYKGTVTIVHIDRVNYIVSGTFDFEAYSTSCNKTIKVTDGRFDLHYAP